MLAIWNRRELVTVLTMQEQSDILSALRDAGLDYAVKVIDRSSPSALNPGTRADLVPCACRRGHSTSTSSM